MPTTNAKLKTAVETYFTGPPPTARFRRRDRRALHLPAAHRPPQRRVGATLKPKVFCVSELADHGAGHPDLGLYTAKQVQSGRVREGQVPERGVIEVKSAGDGRLADRR